jgi:hypothetical protein
MRGTLETAEDVIEALGGVPATARLTGRKDGRVVSNWKVRKRLPADTFLIVSDELKRLGKNASPSVWGITAPEQGA